MSPLLNLSSAVLTHPGRKRPHNEDFVAYYQPDTYAEWVEKGCIYIVADGVGGAAKGEKASQFAAQDVLFRFDNDPDQDRGARLQRAMRAAGNAIFEHAERSGTFTRMATTMVAAVVRGDRLTVANVGDSRAYLIRSGKVHQITTDHTIAGEMLHHGEITEEEAQHLKGKNRITRSIGGERDVRVDIFADIPLQPGDKLLLCSDGLARYTLAEDIVRLTAEGNPDEIVRRCIAFANQRGGVDNISAALVEIGTLAQPGTIPSRGGDVPTAVDWDEMVTQPSIDLPGTRRSSRLKSIHWILIGAAILLLVGILGVVIGRRLFPGQPDADNTPVPPTEPVSDPSSLPDDIGNQPEPTPTETPVPTITPTEAPPSSGTDLTGQPGEPGGDSPVETPLPSGRCTYTVQQSDVGIIQILVDYFDFTQPEAYAYPSQVEDINGGKLPDPDSIIPGDVLVFPFIPDRAACEPFGLWDSFPTPQTPDK